MTFSTFWGPLAFVLIGGGAVDTVLTLICVPSLYAWWRRVPVPQNPKARSDEAQSLPS